MERKVTKAKNILPINQHHFVNQSITKLLVSKSQSHTMIYRHHSQMVVGVIPLPRKNGAQPTKKLCTGVRHLPMEDLCIKVKQLQLQDMNKKYTIPNG